MRILCLNCHRLGNPQLVQELCQAVLSDDPQVLFLVETRSVHCEFERLKHRLGFGNEVFVNWEGFGNGFALLWIWDIGLLLMSFSRSYIDAKVYVDDGVQWRFWAFP